MSKKIPVQSTQYIKKVNDLPLSLATVYPNVKRIKNKPNSVHCDLLKYILPKT